MSLELIKMSNFNNLDFYQLFEIDKTFNESELKKAYYRLSLKYHPDKNSKMEDMFKYINKAYEILNSPQKKKIYDEFGPTAFNGTEIKNEYKRFTSVNHGIPHKKLNDFEVSVFDDLNENSLFRYDESSDDELSSEVLNYSYLSNGEKYALEEKQNNKGSKGMKILESIKEEEMKEEEVTQETSKIKINVTLEELYCGVEKQVKIERKIVCPECLGKQNFMVCDNCLGNGYTYNINLEKEVVCTSCNGEGKKKADKKEQCSRCHGKVNINETKSLIAHILPGMKHDEKIIFRNEGDQSLKSPPDDIITFINVLPHPVFAISGNDLVINVSISLKEALCGLRRKIKFLDGSILSIMSNPGEVISPNSVKLYKNKGLIKNVGSKEKGNLKIKFFVQFPENNWTTLEEIKILEKILSKKTPKKQNKNDTPVEVLTKQPIGAKKSSNKPIQNNVPFKELTNEAMDIKKSTKNKKYIPIEELAKEVMNIKNSNKNQNQKFTPIEELAKEDLDINLNEYPSPVSLKSSISKSSVSTNSSSDKYPISPSGRLTPSGKLSPSPALIKPSTSIMNSNLLSPTKKSPIDQFYLCDIDSGRNRTPRTISIAQPSPLDFENNPPRTVSVIDSLIMPMKGEEIYNSSGSFTNDESYRSDSERSAYRSDSERVVRSMKRCESFKRQYSDDENIKNIKVISPKSLKSPKDLDIIDKNQNVISNNKSESTPPPLPPFPPFPQFPQNQKHVSNVRTMVVDKSMIKTKNIGTLNPKVKTKIGHSNTFNVRVPSPNPGPSPSPTPKNFDFKMSKTIDRVNNPYMNYNI